MPVGERAPLVLAVSRPGRRGSSLDGGAPGWRREVAPALRAALMMAAGDLAMAQGEFARAAELLEASMALARGSASGRPSPTRSAGAAPRRSMKANLTTAKSSCSRLWRCPRANAPFWHALGLTILAAIARSRGDHARPRRCSRNRTLSAKLNISRGHRTSSLMGEIATDLGRTAPRRWAAWVYGKPGQSANGATSLAPSTSLARAVARAAIRNGEPTFGMADAVLETTDGNLPVTALPSFAPARDAVRGAGRAGVRDGVGGGTRSATHGSAGRGRAQGGLGVPAGKG